jgi:protein-L-isoaspartate(D-aspartate) O-methyltransferase
LFTLEDCRAFYAQEIRFAATVVTPGLVEAYARVAREKFLGPAPWQISSAEARALSIAGLRESSYVTINDPRDLYHNVVVALDRAKEINNGRPGALATWIDALALSFPLLPRPALAARRNHGNPSRPGLDWHGSSLW